MGLFKVMIKIMIYVKSSLMSTCKVRLGSKVILPCHHLEVFLCGLPVEHAHLLVCLPSLPAIVGVGGRPPQLISLKMNRKSFSQFIVEILYVKNHL